MPCDSLDTLAARAQAGDRAAANAVAVQVWALAVSIAKRFRRPGVEADDLTAEGLAALPKCLATWDGRRMNFAGYFFTVARNAMANYAAKQRMEAERVGDLVRRARCGNSAPRREAESADAAAADLWAVLNDLPAELREVIDWRRGLTGDRLDIRATARRMGLTRTVAQALYHAAMNELRDRIGAAGE